MPGSLRGLLELNVQLRPDRPVLTYQDRSWTWAELDELAAAFATALVEQGVVPGQRIVLIGKNSPGYFVALFGAAVVDAILVPLNWRLSVPELTAMVRDTEAPLGVIDRELGDLGAELLADLPHLTVTATEDLLAPVADADRTALPMGPADPDAVAFQLYTSGTTGRPKGAMFANGTNLKTLLDDVSAAWDFRAEDVSLLCLPLFHMGGLAWALAGMAHGVETIIVRDFEPTGVLELCERQAVTMTFFVPAMIGALLSVAGRGPELRIRRLMYSGAPMAPSTLIKAMHTFDCDVAQIYGMTEATGGFAQLNPDEHEPGGTREHLLRSAGRAYPWVEVKIMDTATGSMLASGQSGEIWTRSAQNFVGYYRQPDQTAATLTADGWLRTGDIGLMDDEGYLFLLDRRKDMIITGGENVYPAEVEGVLAEYEPLLEVAVIGVPSDKWGETVKAVAVPRDGYTINADDLIAFTRSRIATFKCPTSVDVVRQLPRTATGKVRKDVVREPYWAGYDRHIH